MPIIKFHRCPVCKWISPYNIQPDAIKGVSFCPKCKFMGKKRGKPKIIILETITLNGDVINEEGNKTDI